jgi:hypothetical protein
MYVFEKHIRVKGKIYGPLGGFVTLGSKVYVEGDTLSTGFGDVATAAEFLNPDSNVTRLEISAWRRNVGTDHTTSETRIGRIVDAARMGYIGFNTDTLRRVVLGDMQYGDGSFGEFFRIQADAMMISEHTSAGFQLTPKATQVGGEWAKWHGLTFLPRTDSSGWVRGTTVRRISDAVFVAGMGFIGTNEGVDQIRLGFTSSWWADAHSAPGLTLFPTGYASLRGSGAGLRLYSRNGDGSYYEWYTPSAGAFYLYDSNATASYLAYQANFLGLRGTSPTMWWQDSDHLSFAIHTNSNLAYFMRSSAVDGVSFGSVTDYNGTSRYPLVMNLTNGNIENAGTLTNYNRGMFFYNNATTYNNGQLELYASAGDVVLGLHAAGSTAISILHARGSNSIKLLNAGLGIADLQAGDITLTGTRSIALNGAFNYTCAGISFPSTQAGTTNPNTLDDYEEGTYTPVLTFGGGSTGITYAFRDGRYTKIGRLVHVFLRIQLSNKGSSTGLAKISLPFSSELYGGLQSPFYSGMSGVGSWGGYTAFGDVQLIRFPDGGVADGTEANFTNTTDIILVGTYETSTI